MPRPMLLPARDRMAGWTDPLMDRWDRARARLRRSRPARRAVRRRVAAAGLVALAALWTHDAAARAERARAAWGPGVAVVVAARDVPAGERVAPGDLRVERRPAALVPDAALVRPPRDARAVLGLHRGEVLTAERLADGATGAVAARLPPGTVGVTVSSAVPAPAVATGDRVDLYTAAPAGPDGLGPAGIDPVASGSAERVARAATVVDVDGDRVTVAVRRGEAGATAAAALGGAVVLALEGP